MLMAYCLDTSKPVSLESLGLLVDAPKMIKPWKGEAPTELTWELLVYGLQDAVATLKVFHYLKKQLSSDPDAWELYTLLELPYSLVVQEMEEVGLCFDLEEAEAYRNELSPVAAQILDECRAAYPAVPTKKVKYASKKTGDAKPDHAYIGEVQGTAETDKTFYEFQVYEPFNPSSNKHKAYALLTEGWRPEEYTDGGDPAVGADHIEDLPFPIAKKLVQYNRIGRMVSGFLDPLAGFADDNRMVHGSYNQCVTRTGRLSSSQPNMQNIPRRDERGEKMRSLIICPNEDVLLFNGDLSGIEARIVAFYMLAICGDDSLAKIFIAGEEFHGANGEAWGVARHDAKTFFFSKIYGSSVQGMANKMGVSLADAQGINDKIDRKCPALQQLIDCVVEGATANGGLIHTLFGRRLNYPALLYKKGAAKNEAKRQVFNALIQGSSADIIKYLTLKSMLTIRAHKAVVSATVHDELLGYVSTDRADSLCDSLTHIWSSDTVLAPVPIEATFKAAKTWKDAH